MPRAELGDTKEKRGKNWSLIFAILALIISGISIFISGTNFYFQYLRKYDDLKATILSLTPELPGVQCTADVIFTNNGNRQCSVVAVDLEETVVAGGEEWMKHGRLWIPCLNQPPFTLKSDDVVTKQFRIGAGKLLDSGVVNLKEGILQWALVFGVVDSDGNYHKIRLPIIRHTIGEKGFQLTVDVPKIVKLLPSAVSTKELTFSRPPLNK